MPMPPRPIRPVTTYFPMRRRRLASWPAGVISSLVEPDEQDGDVVLAPPRICGGYQRLRSLLEIAFRIVDDLADVFIRDHRGEAVRAQEQDVARVRLVHLHV